MLRRLRRLTRARTIPVLGVAVILGALFVGSLVFLPSKPARSQGAVLATPSRSTTIALTSDDRTLVVVNRETNSLSVIQVRDAGGADIATKLTEVAVGQDPRCVAVSPDDREAYVTNSASGTVSVIALAGANSRVVAEIPVGTEPRGCAMTPNGQALLVADHTGGTVSAIDPPSRRVLGSLTVGGNPNAIAITNNGDNRDADETVFVTQFFAELIPGGPGEGFDTGKRGVILAFPLTSPFGITRIPLSPLSNIGFTADRTNFCPQTAPNPAALPAPTFCPSTTAAAGSTTITQDPQGAFPNQLFSALIRGGRLYVPSIGASPAPPIRFNVNVQGLVHVADTATQAERTDLHVNLNDQIKAEAQPTPAPGSLVRLFSGDLVAIDANPAGTDFLLVSRGGNYALRAGVDTAGRLNIGAPNVVRFQTGNNPTGVVISRDGRRAYVNNETNVSVTAIDLAANAVLNRDIPSGTPPAPGTFAHAVLLGKLAFFTSLGLPDSGIFATPIRNIVPLAHRNKASDNGWSGCGSCHPDGLADGVTWIFGTGPRQTVPLDSFFAKGNPRDQRISNWSAIMGSITDFNGNARGVQGGTGFAGTPANPNIYPHGITQGASESLDAMTLWVQTVRTPNMPPPQDPAAFDRGRTVFASNCVSCHGGPKWTKSQILYRDNPAFNRDPTAAPVPGVPLDPGVMNTANQIVSLTIAGNTLTYLENVGTFSATDAFEIRTNGMAALGSAGFNVPSLLGIRYHAPYLHNGRAQTLAEVWPLHRLGTGTIATVLTPQQQQDLILYLNSVDGRTPIFRSAADDFRDTVALP